MDWQTVFSTAGQAAMVGWAALLLLPRRRIVVATVRHGAVTGLAALYAALILTHFSGAEGGGFDSIAAVRALFASDPVLVAGWVHYLAFDLLVGTWIAEAADRTGLSRLVQAPILLLTFLFGPVGWLVFQAIAALQAAAATARAVRS